MSCWILGRNQIFTGKSISSASPNEFIGSLQLTDIMLKTHVVPLEVIALLFIGNHLVQHFFSSFGSTLAKIMRCLLCSKGNEVRKLQKVLNRVQVTYHGARARGVIKGLASYNILQNPK